MKSFITRERPFLLIILLVHLIWFGVTILYGNMHTGDSDEYEQQAINLREEGSFYAWFRDQPYDPDYETWRPPVYGSLIMLLKFISPSPWLLLILQNIMSLAVHMILLRLALRLDLRINPRPWIIAGSLLFPSQFMIANSILADTLFLLITTAGLLMLAEYLRGQRMKYLVAWNVLLTLALFVKPVLLYFWIPNLLFSVYLFIKDRRPALLLLPLILPLMAGLWSLRNYYTTGYYQFSSVQHINLLLYNANYTLMHKYGNDYADTVTFRAYFKGKSMSDYPARVTEQLELSKKIILEHPGDYTYMHLKGMALFFLEPGRSDWQVYFSLPYHDGESFSLAWDKGGVSGAVDYARSHNLAVILIMGILTVWNLFLMVSGIAGLILYKKERLFHWFLLVYIMYMCTVTGVVGCARYRLMVYPFLILGMVLWRDLRFTIYDLRFKKVIGH